MAGKEMTALQLRKKALLLESDLNRLRLRADIEQLHEATDITRNLRNLGERIGPWIKTLAPLAGIMAAFSLRRRSSEGGGFFQKALALAPVLIRLWRAFSKPSKEPKPESGDPQIF
jgi:hypothetical protein